MALTVEDGTGLPGAESYASVSEAGTYLRARGFGEAWDDMEQLDREVALRKATDFMRQVYRQRWAGARVRYEQRLDWPRYSVVVDGFAVPSNLVPVDVKQACAELALRAAQGEELLPDQEAGNSQVKREKIGPLDTEYFENSVGAAERYQSVTAMLTPHFGATGSSGMIKVVRA